MNLCTEVATIDLHSFPENAQFPSRVCFRKAGISTNRITPFAGVSDWSTPPLNSEAS